MISVKHPDEECNVSQAAFIASCPPDQRRYHELLFSYGNSAYIYHRQARTFNPCLADYEEWLQGLPETLRLQMQQKGFEACKTVLPFTRYVMEKNDVGMTAFIRELMGEKDFTQMQALAK